MNQGIDGIVTSCYIDDMKTSKRDQKIVSFPLRMPESLRDDLKELCAKKGRIMNSEIIRALKKRLEELEKEEDV